MAVDKSDKDAVCVLLGILYLTGQGIHNDPVEAARLFRKAAEAGNFGAMASLGDATSAQHRPGSSLRHTP